MQKDSPSLHSLPDMPGVYFFIGAKREVLYVGKATSLRDRVRSYFSSDLSATRGSHMVRMVEEARRVEFRVTDSVLEALILEARLIKELKPRYNTRDKDDKSFNYLVITTNETYPRLLTVRGKDLARVLAELETGDRGEVVGSRRTSVAPPNTYNLTPTRLRRSFGGQVTYPLPVYGPFVHAGQFKEALKIVRKMFPYYDTTRPVEVLRAAHDKKLAFNESIGVYPHAPTPALYARTIRHLRLFFDGKKKELVRTLTREMHAHARAERFEDAQEAKRRLFALEHIRDVSLLRRGSEETSSSGVRIEAYDVAHLKGTAMVGVMVVIEHGEPQKMEYRTFTIRTVSASNDTAALREVLSRRLAHPEWPYPKLIVVDGGTAQLNVARAVLAEAGVEIPVVAVVKDAQHRPREVRGPLKARKGNEALILLANSESHRFALATHTRKRNTALRA